MIIKISLIIFLAIIFYFNIADVSTYKNNTINILQKYILTYFIYVRLKYIIIHSKITT